MRRRIEITHANLQRILSFDIGTGKLFWLPQSPEMFVDGKHSAEHTCKAWNSQYEGREAFTALDNNGYNQGCILGNHCKAHRVVWFLVFGAWPPSDIDHINGIRTDNRIENLRLVTVAENNKNLSIPRTNTSGVIGVSWHAETGKWRAQIQVNRKSKHIGLFDDFASAVAARKRAESIYGFHPNHGKPALQTLLQQRNSKSTEGVAA